VWPCSQLRLLGSSFTTKDITSRLRCKHLNYQREHDLSDVKKSKSCAAQCRGHGACTLPLPRCFAGECAGHAWLTTRPSSAPGGWVGTVFRGCEG
jgi:hypothetical protein